MICYVWTGKMWEILTTHRLRGKQEVQKKSVYFKTSKTPYACKKGEPRRFYVRVGRISPPYLNVQKKREFDEQLQSWAQTFALQNNNSVFQLLTLAWLFRSKPYRPQPSDIWSHPIIENQLWSVPYVSPNAMPPCMSRISSDFQSSSSNMEWYIQISACADGNVNIATENMMNFLSDKSFGQLIWALSQR